MIKEYKYNDATKLSEHFKVSEFKCKCGGNHNIKIDTDLVELLEKLRTKLNAKSGNIYSGYRCPTHDKNVGGSGSGPHTEGYAVDIYFIGQDGKRISSKTIALTLEDMGHKYGIGYRCGGSADSTGNIHIDVKPRKWYGDESKSMTKSCCTSFYDYFGIKKVTTYTGTFPTLPSRGYFKKGDKGTQVKNLQKFLNWAISSNLAIDGHIGYLTINAVKEFQKVTGIKADGYFGKDSLSKAKVFSK